MIINLFDANFAHDVCSIAGKVPQNIQYVRGLKEWDGITVFTDSYLRDKELIQSVSSPIKIGWQHEPQCLWPDNYRIVDFDDPPCLDFIMTYYEPLLSHSWEGNHKYTFSPYGGVWIKQEHWGMRPKTKLISMLYGEKVSTAGHRIRHQIGDLYADLYPIDFYGSVRGQPVGYGPATKLQVLGDYKYTIVTETCRQDNLFTEILLDCFAVGTIPIFWGCPNIYKYFNWAGILGFDSFEQLDYLLDLVVKYGDDYYEACRESIEENLELVREYEITEDWQYKHIYGKLEELL